MVEQEEVHRDVDRHEMMVIKLQLKKKKEKQKPRRSKSWGLYK
jgi:hypothetical protein